MSARNRPTFVGNTNRGTTDPRIDKEKDLVGSAAIVSEKRMKGRKCSGNLEMRLHELTNN